MINRKAKFTCILLLIFSILLSSCVDQHPEKNKNDKKSEDISLGEYDKDDYSLAAKLAKREVDGKAEAARIVATSPAVADICDRLNLDLVAISDSNINKLPDRYKDVERIGLPMNPDTEKLSMIKADWILSPVSLMGDLRPKYDAIGSQWAFLNLNSVQGMYKSIDELGYIFNRQEEAKKLNDEFQNFYKTYSDKHKGSKKPKVMILMGLPGSYIIATEHSYVGSLVKLAGGENVYQDDEKQFLNVNTEDMKLKEPDIILRAAHALPQNVKEMFNKEFRENDIWKHFDAVKKGKVYDLSYDKFGMSAKFNYPQALEELEPLLYGGGTK